MFESYDCSERESKPFIHFGENTALVTKGFIGRAKLQKYQYIQLLYDRDKRVIRLVFSKDQLHTSLFLGDVIRGGEWQGFRRFSIAGFRNHFGIDTDEFFGRYSPQLVHCPRGRKIFEIELGSSVVS